LLLGQKVEAGGRDSQQDGQEQWPWQPSPWGGDQPTVQSSTPVPMMEQVRYQARKPRRSSGSELERCNTRPRQAQTYL